MLGEERRVSSDRGLVWRERLGQGLENLARGTKGEGRELWGIVTGEF